MRKSTYAVGALLMLGLMAAPAGAAVTDAANGLSAEVERSLASALERVGPGRFEVMMVDAAPEGAVGAATRLFAARGLGPSDAAIVVSLGERRVGVQVGDGYRARGVDGRTIDRIVATSFAPRAARGDYPGAVLALATALDAAASGAGPVATGERQPAGDGGIPFWLLALPLAAGAFFMMRGRGGMRGRSAVPLADLKAHLAELQARHGRALETALRLDEEGRSGRLGLAEGDPDLAAYTRLDRDTTRLLADASALSDAFTAAEASPTPEALAAIERRLTPLEAELAAVDTALADVTRPGAPSVAFETLPRDAAELAGRLADLQAAYEAEREQAAQLGLGGDPEVEGRLDAARRRLSAVPVDLEAGVAAVAEAREALRRYQTALETAADRDAMSRPQQAGPLLGGVAPIFIVPPSFGGGGFGRHDGGGSAGGGSWSGGGGSDDGGSGGGTW